jgi:adenine-specific DNA-methyltransferase
MNPSPAYRCRDNLKWLSNNKINEHHKPILLGKDVHKYFTDYSGTYINFLKKEMKRNANEDYYKREKVLMRRTGSSVIADIDTKSTFALKNLYLIIPNGNYLYSLLAQLNSKLLAFYHKQKTSGENKAFA